MTIIIVDGPSGSGKTALVDTLVECIPYAKGRSFEGDESTGEFKEALDADNATDTLFSLVTIWCRSWVSGWVKHGLSTLEADSLDYILSGAQGFGVILLGDEDVVDEDERELFADFADDELRSIWRIVEEDESEDLVAQIVKRVKT